jgi:hypothetical protein
MTYAAVRFATDEMLNSLLIHLAAVRIDPGVNGALFTKNFGVDRAADLAGFICIRDPHSTRL